MAPAHAPWLGAAAASAYLLGSVPFGLLVGYAVGRVDIRTLGSGNIGATNAARVLGRGRRSAGFAVFLAVFLLDAAKGAGPVLFWRNLAPEPAAVYAALAAAAGALAGHMFSVFLRLRGGKGVAVGAGAMTALLPLPTLLAAGLFGLVLALGRYVSLGSMAAAAALPLFVALLHGPRTLGPDLPLFLFAAAVAAAVLWKHRSNAARLWAGTESRIGGTRPRHERHPGT